MRFISVLGMLVFYFLLQIRQLFLLSFSLRLNHLFLRFFDFALAGAFNVLVFDLHGQLVRDLMRVLKGCC